MSKKDEVREERITMELVDISWDDKNLAILLSQIKPLDTDEDTLEAIEDWHYWVKQGYQF